MRKVTNQGKFAAITLAVGLALASTPALSAEVTGKQPCPESKPAVEQMSFTCLETAVKALYEVFKSQDVRAIYRVLGPGSAELIYTGDPVADEQMRERVLAAYDESVKIELDGVDRATLLMGAHDFPFPFPLKRVASGWKFDATAGAEEILNRRIGENEFSVIRACLAYGDAQREYATADRDGDGVLEYAQHFESSEGKRDGLYWPATAGEEPSPLGPLYARAQSEGYELGKPGPTPFHGYYYRILKSQGAHAPGGAYDYLVRDDMIGGFALVAYPSKWGASGVMSFMCSHDGIVYQQNLGPDSAAIAAQMTRFEPDEGWERVAP
ncbi:MAG: DUF2950 domain-containing protein [Thiobacillus sp.]